MTMITSWELIMAAHTSWHSSKAASGEKQKQGEERCQPFPLLTLKNRTATSGFYSIKISVNDIFD